MKGLAAIHLRSSESFRIIEGIVQRLSPYCSLHFPIDWQNYQILSERISSHFTVPSTSCSALMRQLFFALGYSYNPNRVVAVGTFVGFCISWLLGIQENSRRLEQADLIDIDLQANIIARENCSILGFGERIKVLDGSGEDITQTWREAVQLLYLDLDDPNMGKIGYRTVLNNVFAMLSPEALIVAHDPCVARFRDDFRKYHDYIVQTEAFHGPWVFPIDACGVSIAVRRS